VLLEYTGILFDYYRQYKDGQISRAVFGRCRRRSLKVPIRAGATVPGSTGWVREVATVRGPG
jgi:hypothetical protein